MSENKSQYGTPEKSKEWSSEPDDNGVVHIPDELYPLFNKLGMQLRFHTISGENEIVVVARMVKIAQEFFSLNSDMGSSSDNLKYPPTP